MVQYFWPTLSIVGIYCAQVCQKMILQFLSIDEAHLLHCVTLQICTNTVVPALVTVITVLLLCHSLQNDI